MSVSRKAMILFAFAHDDEGDADDDHGAAGEGAPAELFVQDEHAEYYGDDGCH